ncbi:ABC transporter permease [Streptomyces umbrinus]|uniref:ABC transporter permease n=1 Tax=Streptomyces umbrinus TaxID=67370 RepID=UPI003C2DAEFD
MAPIKSGRGDHTPSGTVTLRAADEPDPIAAGSIPQQTQSLWARLRTTTFLRIWILTALLFAGSAVAVPGTVTATALLSMLPFAAILAMASSGQALVVQQGGIDLSCAGVISLTAVITVTSSHSSDGELAKAVLIALAGAAACGLVAGLSATRLGITPLIATLALNAVLTGVVIGITGGNIAEAVPHDLASAVSAKLLGIQVVIWIPVLVVLTMTVVLRRTVVGRRFEAIGANPAAAAAMGMRVAAYQTGAYVIAAVCYAAAGILLAGFITRPDLFSGNDYLLLTIAAVALGGTTLGGGRSSVLATAVGALFLVQLNQVVLAGGAPTAMQYVIQGAVLICGIGLQGRNGMTRLIRMVRS